LNYLIYETDNCTVVKVSGKISKSAVLSSGAFIRSLIERDILNIILHIDGLEDERDLIYHIALINSFKKAVENAGGDFVVISNRDALKNYLSSTGLSRIFPVITYNSEMSVI
jgi:anti-anti-sigma factor